MSIRPQQQTQPVTDNLLLARLLVHERNAVQRGSVVIACTPGQILLKPNVHPEFIFFPIDVTVSIIRSLRDGNRVQLGLVGNEGIVGFDALMDSKVQADGAVVQSSGNAYCMPADELRRQFHRGGMLQKYLLRFTNAFLSQLAQNAACIRFHSLESRLARWLLMTNDRSGSDVDGTASTFAEALGASETSMENALARLAGKKAIRRRRESVQIADTETLEVDSCECYESLRQVYDNALG